MSTTSTTHVGRCVEDEWLATYRNYNDVIATTGQSLCVQLTDKDTLSVTCRYRVGRIAQMVSCELNSVANIGVARISSWGAIFFPKS